MKYCVVIMDGAAGRPLPGRHNKTSLQVAHTPNLDEMAKEGIVGMSRNVPEGMEPTSACACMSVLGYDPTVYYKGRSGIEAISIGVPVGPNDVTFRCNFVTVKDGKMASYSAGYITTEEARGLIDSLNQKLGSDKIKFFTGTNYRHILRITGQEDTLNAVCTPPHDISDQHVDIYMPKGPGSKLLLELMEKSKKILEDNPLHLGRLLQGKSPASMIWLFWGSGKIPDMPAFNQLYGVKAAMSSPVDLLKGIASMIQVDILDIPGVTDNKDNNYVAQAEKSLEALHNNDLVVIHIEAPDEAGHDGSMEDKIEAIEKIDKEVIGRIRGMGRDKVRLLVIPDHPTPVELKTHSDEPVPFLLWGPGFHPNGAEAFNEAAAKRTGIFFEKGHEIMGQFIRGFQFIGI
jgi:2,3-bisphosphoglycerate-independent phosphoglycerate mutase